MRRLMKALCFFAAVCLPEGLSAQIPHQAPAAPPWGDVRAGSQAVQVQPWAVAVKREPSYVWEGAAVGALTTGVLGSMLAAGLADADSGGGGASMGSAIGGFVLMAPIGLIIGGMVGGMIPKY